MKNTLPVMLLITALWGCSPETPNTEQGIAPFSHSMADMTAVHPATVTANKASVSALDFSDRRDFERADKGFIATFDEGIPNYDPTAYDFLKAAAPDSVHPSLWRQSQLLSKHGLFKVTDGIYQVRSFKDP